MECGDGTLGETCTERPPVPVVFSCAYSLHPPSVLISPLRCYSHQQSPILPCHRPLPQSLHLQRIRLPQGLCTHYSLSQPPPRNPRIHLLPPVGLCSERPGSLTLPPAPQHSQPTAFTSGALSSPPYISRAQNAPPRNHHCQHGRCPANSGCGRTRMSPPPSLPLQPRIGLSQVQTCWPESIPGSPLPGAPSVLWAQVCARSPGRTPRVLMAWGGQLGAQRAVPRVSDCPWRPPPAACPSHPESLSCGRGVGGSHREAALGSLPEDHGQTWTGVSEEFQGFFRRPTNVSLPQTCTGNSENPQDWGHWGLCFRETHCKPEL